MIISFPNGGGGHWLKTLLDSVDVKNNNLVNFHHVQNKKSTVRILHSTDPAQFDLLLSGKCYFNFYSNVIYKWYYKDHNFFEKETYSTAFLQAVNAARFICNFDNIHNLTFFDFDQLILNPENFFSQVVQTQIQLELKPISIDDFLIKKDHFLSTCVNVSDIYENFDNMIWVCFVIGQLMNLNVVPTDFLISESTNQNQCKQFAQQNYKLCNLNQVHFINSDIFLPKLL